MWVEFSIRTLDRESSIGDSNVSLPATLSLSGAGTGRCIFVVLVRRSSLDFVADESVTVCAGFSPQRREPPGGAG
jgi:hypothetical protein